MSSKNRVKKQHFISQSEQKLNSSNYKLMKFAINNREIFQVIRSKNNEIKILNNLQITDLYTYEIGNDVVLNFERLFHKYESNISVNSKSLLEKNKSGDIKPEILNIFATKMLNFIRNPYSIRKMLNTFPDVDYQPTISNAITKLIEEVENSKKPQFKYICDLLNISNAEYNKWLTKIFFLTVPLENGYTIFDYLIKELFENKNSLILVSIYNYKEKYCLLSDRGFTIPVTDTKHSAFDFNLTANSFIRYFFGDIDSLTKGKYPKGIIENYKKKRKNVTVYFFDEELEELEKYNQRVVFQGYENVYCGSDDIYGIEIQEK